MKYRLAIDIGASSGRLILGSADGGKISLEEVYRFENRQVRLNGHDCWDLENLFSGIISGLKRLKEISKIPETVGIDTWAVDFVLLDREDKLIGDAVAYRDARTEGMDSLAEEKIPFKEHYARTGIQKQNFNTVYQLLALKEEKPEELENAETLLMIPDYLNFLLTGEKRQEYTNATTTDLVNAKDRTWDRELIDIFGLPQKLFGELSLPGEEVGEFSPKIADEVGFSAKVILPATHDTGSAFLSVPAEDENTVYLSSGTWSLLGVERGEPDTSDKSLLANFTNEGGAWYRFRFLKNIMGLWMIQSVRRELNGVSYVRGKGREKRGEGENWSFSMLSDEARRAEDFPSVVDPNSVSFLSPPDMREAVREYCKNTGQAVPGSVGEIMHAIYFGLAQCYRSAIEELGQITGRQFKTLCIVGGGCRDEYLNQLTAKATGLKVLAGPVEGTAIGNLLLQFIAGGEFPDLSSAREAVRQSFEIKEY